MKNPNDGRLTQDEATRLLEYGNHARFCAAIVSSFSRREAFCDCGWKELEQKAVEALDVLEAQPVGPDDFSSEEEYRAWCKKNDITPQPATDSIPRTIGDDTPEAGADVKPSTTTLEFEQDQVFALYLERNRLRTDLVTVTDELSAVRHNCDMAQSELKAEHEALRRVWEKVAALRAERDAEREAHATTRESSNKLAQRLWDAAEDLHNERGHPGKFHACRVQLCKLDRESQHEGGK